MCGEAGRHRRYGVRRGHLAVFPVVPAAVNAGREEQCHEEHDPAREAALLQRLGEDKGLTAAQPADLVLEFADDQLAVEAQELGIGAHEAKGIGRSGKILEAAVLDGLEVAELDAERPCHLREIEPQRQPGCAQGGGNPVRRGVAPPAVAPAAAAMIAFEVLTLRLSHGANLVPKHPAPTTDLRATAAADSPAPQDAAAGCACPVGWICASAPPIGLSKGRCPRSTD